MYKTLIIGKNSNLSKELSKKLNNCILISSREVFKDINILNKYLHQKINIIFNNFQSAIQLNNTENSKEYIVNSILITSMILDYFKNSCINKIIYTSSSSVYGNNILCNENDELKPINLHASLKVSNEKLIEKYCFDNKIDYTITRVFNMYGGEDKFSVISKIIRSIKNDSEMTIVNNGNAIRDFIFISDVVYIYDILLSVNDVKILNIGTGIGSSIKNIIDFLTNNNINLKTNNIFKDELKTSTADNKLLYEVINKDKFFMIEDYLKKEFNL